MQSMQTVVEVQAADAKVARSGEARGFGETAAEFSGGESANCHNYA